MLALLDWNVVFPNPLFPSPIYFDHTDNYSYLIYNTCEPYLHIFVPLLCYKRCSPEWFGSTQIQDFNLPASCLNAVSARWCALMVPTRCAWMVPTRWCPLAFLIVLRGFNTINYRAPPTGHHLFLPTGHHLWAPLSLLGLDFCGGRPP